MGLSRLDLWYRKLILTKFYTKGWGKPEELKEILKMQKLISNRESCLKLVSPTHPVKIDETVETKQCTLLHGHFVTPLMNIVPNLIPPVAQVARFEMVLPKNRLMTDNMHMIKEVPACIHMAGTGDHGYHRRRELLAKPMLKSGIASVLLENPFYGSRKPKEQRHSGLLHVNDLFVMGGCLILEALVLLHWLNRQGYGPLGLTGISMGGHMASLAATNWPEPLALIPCMSWTSASVVWTEGVLSKTVPWRVLESQYAKDPIYEKEIMNILSKIDSYNFGKSFVKKHDGAHTTSAQKTTEVNGMQDVKDVEVHLKRTAEEKRRKETLKFMKGVMDEITHLRNYSIPVDPTAVTFVIAKDDAYFPQSSLENMKDVWPGCEVREMKSGHIAGYLIHNDVFVQAILDTFARLIVAQQKAVKEKKNSSNLTIDGSDNKKDLLKFYKKQSLPMTARMPIFTIIKSLLRKA